MQLRQSSKTVPAGADRQIARVKCRCSMQPWSCLRQLLGGFSCSEKAWFNENRSPEAVLVSWHPHQRCGDERGPLPPIRESILRTIQGRISSIGLVAALHTSTRTEKALLHVGPLSNTWSRQNQSMRRGRSVASLLSTQIAAVKANTAKKSSQACRRQLPIHGFAPAADAELRTSKRGTPSTEKP